LFGSSDESRLISKFTEGKVRNIAKCDDGLFSPVAEYCGASAVPSWGEFGDSPTQGSSSSSGHELWCNALSFTTEGEGNVSGKHGMRCMPEHLKFHASSSSNSKPALIKSRGKSHLSRSRRLKVQAGSRKVGTNKLKSISALAPMSSLGRKEEAEEEEESDDQAQAPHTCDSIEGVTLDQVLWHYNASATRPKLQELYYR
jgi:hypothetical protein